MIVMLFFGFGIEKTTDQSCYPFLSLSRSRFPHGRSSTHREDGTEERRRDVKPSCDTTTYGLFINQLNQAASRSKDA